MKNSRSKKYLLLLLLGGVCYLALLLLLIYAESFSENPSITTLGEAAWFSLVTLTTVGYGDDFPVTVWGKLIGILFLLGSTGLLALCISMAVSLITGRLLPRLRLRKLRKRSWYIFSSLNQESAALAANLSAEQPEAVILFCQDSKNLPREFAAHPLPADWHLIDASLSDFLSWKGSEKDCTFLIMGSDSYANYFQAQNLTDIGIPVYCQTDFSPDNTPEHVTLFDRWDCCARLYWQQYPLAETEKQVLLAGCGRYGAALLERALLVNIYGPRRPVTYHVFGDNGAFQNSHFCLEHIEDLEGNGSCHDTVVFHKESWDENPLLLSQADRVILCMDSDQENQEAFQRLQRYFPTNTAPHLRLSHKLDHAVSFGTDETIFTPALVLRTQLNRLAMGMHEIYRRSSGSQIPDWNHLGDFLRRSNLAAADHLLTKIRILLTDDTITEITADNCHAAYRRYLETKEQNSDLYREIEHIRWMRFYIMHNWQYAPQRDNSRRLHPDIRPFSQLSVPEQEKDDYAWELLENLSEILSHSS